MAHPADARVLVVGGGFGGSYAARTLREHDIAVTLVDANGFQTFQPLLYQAATGLVDRADVEFPLAEIAGVDVVTGQVAAVDLDTRSVTLDGGRSLTGDHLVLATGTVVNYFGVDGAAETALPLYTSADARAIKARLQQLVSPTGSFSVVVVGAGATGVEVTGAITDVVTEILPNTYPAFRTENIAVHLVDRAAAPLASMSERSQEYARTVLERCGVHLHLGRSVASVTPTSVLLDDGTSLAADMTIWAGGLSVRLPDLHPEPETGRGGRVLVEPDLSLAGHPDVYVIGDAAADRVDPLPQLGSVAKQQGIAVGKAIDRRLRGKQPHPFSYRDMGDMAMIRHDAAAVEVGPHHKPVDGKLAYLMWLGLHAYLLPGDHNRRDVLHSWVVEQTTGTSQFVTKS